MGKVVERFFNIFDPPSIVIDRVEDYISVTLLYSPRIYHKASLKDFCDALSIHFGNPLSFPLLLICNGLFPLILIGGRAWRILEMTRSFLAYPHTLARGRRQLQQLGKMDEQAKQRDGAD